MNLTTYIVDDESHAIDIIADYINRTPGLSFSGSSTDPVAALDILTSDHPPGLTFLDIDMPGVSGLELANMVAGKTAVVFITSYREFGPEAFQVNAIDYLLKPISYAAFLKCIHKVQERLSTAAPSGKETGFIFVKGDLKGKYIRIIVSDILYIQSSLHYVDIFLPGEKITTYLTLSELEEKLSVTDFCRVHRSFIVNLKRIKAIEQSQIRLENKELIPIGRGYREEFFRRINPTFLVSQKDNED
ncbi:LytTR family DNA-binding domain-containing protein [Mucilaginibacter sp. BJC16-A38]|uniref:LytR/AlgR family response regulator transcription factor n=1 Tax=Mucilaginibacter phenanthrenivorans TaxID=1234842 RepID=UPI002157D8B2|nr:LytTR family DNA-binding domain-containing protein [Mucilaginibacter phenanthrenivorans]MCR8560430.1 LytTR family DNA-binding domain-containing protein [Mucilaginibacter phenanthrenivorans]